jgi:serine-type D-Ala-D-Ala carboxypeptidase (penicillin-binding protein 5/6)
VLRPFFALAVLATTLLAGLGSAAAAPPAVQAQTYYVESAYDGAVLAQRDAALSRPMASITKLMTVLVALEHAKPDELVTVPRAATGIGESTLFLRPGEPVTVRDLALGALVPSANDAAMALALYVGNGSVERFVALMNAKAEQLGLPDTHYVNPHGLDQPGQVSSARDSARLLRAALAVPFIGRAAHLTRVETAGRNVASTDDVLALEPRIVGGKTGHTDGAGWSQTAAARANGVTVYAAVLGSPSRIARNADLLALLRWSLAQYRRVATVTAGRTYAVARAPYGRPAVRLVALRSATHTVRVGRPLVERVVAPPSVSVPLARHARLGEVRVYDGGRLIAREPLVAASAVAEPGVLGKARWYATRTLHHLSGLVS